MKANKYVCIHGHFYQPPRENAWLGAVELQDSATPFHDWNERINFECYAPNTSARILDEEGKIINILSNYARISFNFGPTLLSWLEQNDPGTYLSILDADKRSMEHFDGHGSALAQAYSHLITPLANPKDIETQVKWGIADFKHRFDRHPEGMWLAETAVDTATLEVMAENNIKFTILAPRQGKAIRKVGEENWTELVPDSIDPRRPYLCKLPSGKEIMLFFYHGGIAQGVAFDGLLNDGELFASKFYQVFDDNDSPQLAHIATDGESYGHHHRHGEMALAACLKNIEVNRDAQLTNYGQYLELFPVEYEAQIHENSSWSCVHGVERWCSNCGCHTGGHNDWTQSWRKPLRDSLNWLRDELIPIYLRETEELLHRPWEARNAYIEVILDRNEATYDAFLNAHSKGPLTKEQKTKLFRLMEMQRHAILMFTSCGWFFDEISGIETDQILQYANRAIHYAEQVANIHLHDTFIRKLEEAHSNIHENGATSYKNNVMPAKVDLVRMGMHYAASSLFEAYPEDIEIFNYRALSESFVRLEAGSQKLAIGRTTVHSKITYSRKHFSFAVLYLGQQNIIGNISIDMEKKTFDKMASEITAAFESTNLGVVIGLMQSYFGPEKFSIWHLFRDEKRKILREITGKSLKHMEATLRDFYKDNYQLMTGVQRSNIPLPKEFKNAAETILNKDLQDFFENGDLNVRALELISKDLKKWGVQITNRDSISLNAGERIYKELQQVLANGFKDQKALKQLNKVMDYVGKMGLEINLWKSQNLYFSMLKTYNKLPENKRSAKWEKHFYKLGDYFGMRTPKLKGSVVNVEDV
jgi:alpha-amylase/alpha-mannosidase (GH57 family)